MLEKSNNDKTKEDELLEADKKKADMLEVERRVYQVSLMLRRKSIPFILQYASENWKIGDRQTRTYIKKARKEWSKYSEKLKDGARAYSLAKLRDLNDMAHGKKVVVGTVDNKKIMQVEDLNLILDISKEEAKLMGLYIEKKEVGPPGSFAEWVKEVKKEKERRRKKNSKSDR